MIIMNWFIMTGRIKNFISIKCIGAAFTLIIPLQSFLKIRAEKSGLVPPMGCLRLIQNKSCFYHHNLMKMLFFQFRIIQLLIFKETGTCNCRYQTTSLIYFGSKESFILFLLNNQRI